MGKNQKTQSGSGRRRASTSRTRGSEAGDLKKSPISREFSSGGVVYKPSDTVKEGFWLIRSTKPNDLFPKQHWTLPKGWIDDEAEGIPGPIASGRKKATEEDLQKTAIREVREEGGVEASIVKKIGSTKIFYKHPLRGPVLKFITFYLMKWEKDLLNGWDEETEEVVWLPFDEACKKLSFSNEKQILKKAEDMLV